MAMTQSQLIRALAEGSGTNNKTARAMLETLVSTALRETKKVGVFKIPGLGRLKLVNRKARMGRNPATGEPIKIPAKKAVRFAVAKVAKEAISPKKK